MKAQEVARDNTRELLVKAQEVARDNTRAVLVKAQEERSRSNTRETRRNTRSYASQAQRSPVKHEREREREMRKSRSEPGCKSVSKPQTISVFIRQK